MATYSHANKCPGRNPIPFSRRAWLQHSANGFGTIALASLLADQSEAAQRDSPGRAGFSGPYDPARIFHPVDIVIGV